MDASATIRSLGLAASLVRWLALVLALAGAARAQSVDNTIRVDDIRVEARAADAVQAQLQAIAEGQRRGLEQLLQQRTAGSGQAPPSLAGVDVGALVASFEILEETVAPGSYAATMAVSYRRPEVEALLRGAGVGFVRDLPPPALLLPLWETGSGVLLWERENAWKAAVDHGLDDRALARFVVPLGDLQDLALLDSSQAVRADAQALARLGARYGTESVVLARLIGDGAQGAPLAVEARRVGGAAEPAYRSVVRRLEGEPLEVSLARAVQEMQAAFDQRVRERSMVPGGPQQRLILIAPVGDAVAWGSLLADLAAPPEVASVAVSSLNRREATLELEIAGGVERLQQTLGLSGWTMIADGADRWRLQRGGQPAASAVPPLR